MPSGDATNRIDQHAYACVYSRRHGCLQEVLVDPRYPIGNFEMPAQVTPARRQQAMDEIAGLPGKMQEAIKGLNDAQLDTPYRAGGWTVRQVVHHVPDSHLNAYVRLKLALTEDKPTIKPYDQEAWSKLADSKSTPIEVSLALLASVHDRWNRVWRSLAPEQFARPLVHPENGERTIDWLLFLYAWHGKHHTAHITELRRQKGW